MNESKILLDYTFLKVLIEFTLLINWEIYSKIYIKCNVIRLIKWIKSDN